MEPTTYRPVGRWRLYGVQAASDKERDRDRRRGRCTGLPACCIEYFVGPWMAVLSHRSTWDAELEFRAVHAERVGYVPCPLCRAERSFVKPRRCRRGSCRCGGWRR